MSDIGPSYERNPKHNNGPRATVNLRTNSEYRALKIDSTRSFSGVFGFPFLNAWSVLLLLRPVGVCACSF